MKKCFFIATIYLFSFPVFAQFSWGGSTGSSAKIDSSSAPILVIPKIDARYDDAPEAHYEPPWVPKDGRLSMEQGTVVAYPYLREADYKFRRRVWRRIDLRQKMNKSFAWPKNPLTEIVYNLGVKGLVPVYWTDSLDRIMPPGHASVQAAKRVTIPIVDWRNPGNDDDLVDSTFFEMYSYLKIQKFEVMEDWIFDYKHSEFRPRIIAIAPMYQEKFPNGMTFDLPLFWMKMDDIRPTLAMSEVYNRYNDAMRISWDDLFNNYRLFDSYIVKQTDWDDSYISYKPEFQQDGLAALIEGENIKNDLFIFDHDIWEY